VEGGKGRSKRGRGERGRGEDDEGGRRGWRSGERGKWEEKATRARKEKVSDVVRERERRRETERKKRSETHKTPMLSVPPSAENAPQLRSRHESLLPVIVAVRQRCSRAVGTRRGRRKEKGEEGGGRTGRARVGDERLDLLTRRRAGDRNILPAVGAAGVGVGREGDEWGRVRVDVAAVLRAQESRSARARRPRSRRELQTHACDTVLVEESRDSSRVDLARAARGRAGVGGRLGLLGGGGGGRRRGGPGGIGGGLRGCVRGT